MRLATPRLVLRDFEETDRAAFVAYQADPRYRRLYGISESDGTAARDLFDRFLSWQREEPRANLQLGVFDGRTGRLCGSAGLRRAGQEEATAVLGIELAPDEWGRWGVAVEVAAALLRHAFGEMALGTVLGTTASGNRRVERLARWFGARIVARRDGPPWMAAQGWSEVDWALTREAWERAIRLRGRRTLAGA